MYGPLCRSLTFWMLFSDSVDNDNNYNDDKSYEISMIIMLVTMILIILTVDNDINNNNSFRKYSLSYPEPP